MASKFLAISVAVALLGATATARLRPRYGGTLRIETSHAAIDSSLLTSLTSETLTSADSRDRLSPSLADRWESQNGDRRWIFTLHPRITMQDGTPLTGTVVAEALANAQGPVQPWQTVRGTDSSVVFDSATPMPKLPVLLASPAFAIFRRSAQGWPVGTGAFTVTSAGSAGVVLQANDQYWRGRPFIDAIEITGPRSLRSQWLDIGAARADVVEVPGESLRRAQQEHLRTVSRYPGELVALVVSDEINDQRLRRALSLSVDRASLAGVVFQRQGQPAVTILPDTMTGYAVLFGSGYDVSASRTLRAELGATPPMTISYDASEPSMQLTAERIALNAREAGLNVTAEPEVQGRTTSARLVRVPLPSVDPAVCLEELTRTLLARQAPVANGIEDLFGQESAIVNDYRLIPLVHLPAAAGVSSRVRDLQIKWDGADVQDAWIEERR